MEGISGLTKAQVNEPANSASTPQEHLQLAEHYRSQYTNLMEESKNGRIENLRCDGG